MWLVNNDVDAEKFCTTRAFHIAQRKIYFFNTGVLESAHSVSFACVCGAVHVVQHSEHESFSFLLVVYLPFHCRDFFATDPSPSRALFFFCTLCGNIVLLVRVPNCLESTSSLVFQLLNLFYRHIELARDMLTCYACTDVETCAPPSVKKKKVLQVIFVYMPSAYMAGCTHTYFFLQELAHSL